MLVDFFLKVPQIIFYNQNIKQNINNSRYIFWLAVRKFKDQRRIVYYSIVRILKKLLENLHPPPPIISYETLSF